MGVQDTLLRRCLEKVSPGAKVNKKKLAGSLPSAEQDRDVCVSTLEV